MKRIDVIFMHVSVPRGRVEFKTIGYAVVNIFKINVTVQF